MLEHAMAADLSGRTEEAAQALKAVLQTPEALPEHVQHSLRWLLAHDGADLGPEQLIRLPAIVSLPPEECAILAKILLSENRPALAGAMCDRALAELPIEAQREDDLVLSLIALGRHQPAMKLLADNRPIVGNDIQTVFNYAMSEWAYTRTPPQDLFERVIELNESGSENISKNLRESPNYLQCMAIAYFVAGRTDAARGQLEQAFSRIPRYLRNVFSAWRYYPVSVAQFSKDLDALGTMINGQAVVPAFFGVIDAR